jgi:hypothetical protein
LQKKVKNTLLDMGIDSDESLILSQWIDEVKEVARGKVGIGIIVRN